MAAGRKDVMCYIYSRPTFGQALKEAMKDYLRDEPELAIGAVLALAVEEYEREQRDVNPT